MPNFPYTSSTVNMQIMNQFHTHSQKKQNPAKKFIKSSQIEIAQRRRRWDCAVKARSVRSSDERHDRRWQSTRGVIDEHARRTITLLVDHAAHRSTSGAIAGEVSSSSLSLRSGLSLLSLSLSLFSEMIWTENKSVKLFPGQRSKYWSTGNEFLENFIFHCSQTCGFGGKWFPEIIFTQNKRTLRLCLVRVKVFPENILFSRNAIFRKGKCFHVFGCHKIRFTEN